MFLTIFSHFRLIFAFLGNLCPPRLLQPGMQHKVGITRNIKRPDTLFQSRLCFGVIFRTELAVSALCWKCIVAATPLIVNDIAVSMLVADTLS